MDNSKRIKELQSDLEKIYISFNYGERGESLTDLPRETQKRFHDMHKELAKLQESESSKAKTEIYVRKYMSMYVEKYTDVFEDFLAWLKTQ